MAPQVIGRRGRRAAGLFVLASSCLLATWSAPSWAYTDGATTLDGLEGCAIGPDCHTNQAGERAEDSRIVVVAQGVPETFTARTSYDIELRYAGPPELRRAGEPGTKTIKAGFAADALVEGEPLGGFFETQDDRTRLVGDTLTHTRDGTYWLNWTFAWVAPAEAARPVELFFTVMGAAGASIQGTNADSWNTERFVVWPAPAGTPAPAALACFALVGLVALLRARLGPGY